MTKRLLVLIVLSILALPVAALPAKADPPQSTNPCYDYQALEAGRGDPPRQDAFNHLDAQGYARWRMACVYGWGGDQFVCLRTLWNEESGWRHDIRSGIPQAMPENKMASAGADYRTNPRTQVRWGLDYIFHRDGTPEGTPHHCHAGY